MPLCVLLFLLLTFSTPAFAQQHLQGQVLDAATHQPLPFATISWENSGTVADLNGYFSTSIPESVTAIQVSYLGYEPKRIALTGEDKLTVLLNPAKGNMSEFVVTPDNQKLRRIINATVASRSRHNPDLYPQYQCRVYYKMITDVTPPESLKVDTSADSREGFDFLNTHHLLISETYTTRSWRKPQTLQEDVQAQRISGFKNPAFTSLITDVLPFHAYHDFIQLNGRDYASPIAPGWQSRFFMSIQEELITGSDTLWVIRFKPKGTQQQLNGALYIQSGDFALTKFLATAKDSVLKRSIRMEQQYAKKNGKWFPEQLNYIFDWQMESDGEPYAIHMKGTSVIDSVRFQLPENFRFDKAHTVRVADSAGLRSDSIWQAVRPVALSDKETNTYQFIDSIGEKFKVDRYLAYVPKLLEGKVPVGPLDIALKRIIAINDYEKYRFGFGLQTNEKITKWGSVGGWAGYGIRDQAWKYGGFLEGYAGRHKETVFKIAYDKDLRDPGRLQLYPGLDKNYLRSYLLQRVDKVENFSASLSWRYEYLSAILTAQQEKITPMYPYLFQPDASTIEAPFTFREATLQLRYAYGMRRTPVFGTYVDGGSRYLVLYASVKAGQLENETKPVNYLQAIGSVDWQTHINRLGRERIRLTAGKSFSEHSLPMSKLFAGNGFRTGSDVGLYVFGTLQTARTYDYYMDQFVTFSLLHQFDWRLYRLQPAKGKISSAPSISIAYNILLGDLAQPSAHQLIDFKIPNPAYHEAGLMLDNLLRITYLNLYYISLNAGYFYHFTPGDFKPENGVFVFGLGVEI